MNLSDRIQSLRKAKGISQEELADRIGVSRQSVSKWEGEQSIPDVDKIVLMSDYFGVTTDYILKGIESSEQIDRRADARIFVLIATVLNFTGLVTASAIWYEKQVAWAFVAGFSLLALGCMVFGVGMVLGADSTKRQAKRTFWSLNIWLLVFLPLSFCYNLLFSGVAAPYPLLVAPLIAFPAFWIVYIAIGLTVDFALIKAKRS